ncbi:penicillin-binding protein 1C [Alkalicaulis satelles]|uniref:peptidoglycan glycosyltransferase n=2 Tax=Alkalicaulis satelles TaxID=2609175 RepID=A0A5M6ZFT6_9PROT|nr:penicillin-binding protein 1C [Alkalicaulis satelles]
MPGRPVVVLISGVFVMLSAVFVLKIADLVLPPPIEAGRSVSLVVADREGRALRAFPVEEGRWRLAADLDRIDPAFIDALLAVEDRRFYRHGGVDALAMIRAVGQAVMSGRIQSGASTITMQTARLLEPRPDRTIGAKLIEMARAVQLERRLSKDEILELYLTLAPYGGNLQGVRAASWAWFDREPDRLTPDQIALLIALPQAPEARRPDLRPEAARSARARLLQRMARLELISETRAADAADEAIPEGRHAFPARAWHAAETIRARATIAGEVRSTLDARLQGEAERLVAALAQGAGEAVQASALIVEIETRAVRAAVGSAGLDRAGGWLDLTDRRRSPGSALKPLIYALAFEDGSAAPGTRIADLPARFASYQPENFDRLFRGEVTVAEALQHSLNVPAVRVLDQVGANRFTAVLSQAGGAPSLPGARGGATGLAVGLGGLGLSARDLALVYAALGDEGRARPLVWTEGEESAARRAPVRLIAAPAAREVITILEGSPAPPGRMPARLTSSAPAIAYKTGTSYGYRDAWAAGVAGGYVIVVWTGRPDGAPRPGVTGRAAALPALFDLYDAVARIDPGFAARARPRSSQSAPTPRPLERFERDGAPPEILFPPDGAEIWAEDGARGFVLAARGEGRLGWYADGAPVPRDAGGSPLWTPGGPGFYTLTAVDGAGRTTRVRVRVRMPAG